MMLLSRYTLLIFAMLSIFCTQTSSAAVALDRTRVIFDGTEKSVTLSISNQNTQLPFLAQAWIENEQSEKITSPLVVLPPIQRLEPGANSQLKIQGLPALAQLPQDRESVFYFNVREIPPRSEKPNTLQIALQTRIKLFYRPLSIAKIPLNATPWQEQLTLTRQKGRYVVNNPTPYYITLIDAARDINVSAASNFKPIMIAPMSQEDLGLDSKAIGEHPVVTYVNDFGGRPQLQFECSADNCKASPITAKR